MGTVTRLRRSVGADPERWLDVDERDLPTAAAIVATSIGLLALNRFGGLVVEAPRLFTRSIVIGLWGWIGLGAASWLVARLWPGHPTSTSFTGALTVAGRAHLPLLGLAIVLFIAAGILQLRLPGLVASIVVFGAWMPIGFITGLSVAANMSWQRASLVGGGPYAVWLIVIGGHLRTQLGHLV